MWRWRPVKQVGLDGRQTTRHLSLVDAGTVRHDGRLANRGAPCRRAEHARQACSPHGPSANSKCGIPSLLVPPRLPRNLTRCSPPPDCRSSFGRRTHPRPPASRAEHAACLPPLARGSPGSSHPAARVCSGATGATRASRLTLIGGQVATLAHTCSTWGCRARTISPSTGSEQPPRNGTRWLSSLLTASCFQ